MEKILNKIKEMYNIKFVKDTLTLQIGTVTIMVIGFITTIIMARVLHPVNYGVYALILSLYGLVNFFGNFGVDKATVIGLAEARAKGDRHLIVDTLASFIKVSLAVGLIIFVIGFIISPYLAHILYGKREIGNLTRILFLMPLLGIFYELVCVAFHGLRMMMHLTIMENIFRLCKTVFIVIALLLGFGLSGIVISLVANSLTCSIIAVLTYKKIQLRTEEMPSLDRILKGVIRVRVAKHFKFGLSMALDKSLFNLYGILPVVILGRFASHSDVGYFKIAKDLITYIVYLFWPVYRNLSAKLPAVLIHNGRYYLRKVFVKVSLVSGVAAIILVTSLLFITPFIVTYFYGKEYVSASPLVYIFLIYLVAAGFNVGLPALYQTLKQIKPIIYIKLLTMIFLLPVGLILIKSKGAQGAALFYDGLVLVSSLLTFFFMNHLLINLKRDDSVKIASMA